VMSERRHLAEMIDLIRLTRYRSLDSPLCPAAERHRQLQRATGTAASGG